jgi:hypothetical protein
MERNNKIAIKKPGVKDEKKERPKTNKDFFDKVGKIDKKNKSVKKYKK